MTAHLLSLQQPRHGLPPPTAFVPRGGASLAWPNIGSPRRLASEPPAPKKSLSTAIAELWYIIPMPLRYFVSGNIGNVCLYFLEKSIRTWMVMMGEATTSTSSMDDDIGALPTAWWSVHQDAISFFTAYLLHIVAQHLCHALLVYGLSSINTRQKYWTTLIGTYQAFIVSAIGSTLINTRLVKLGFDRNIAFVSTLWLFACLNYFWIGLVVSRAKKTEQQQQAAAAAAAKPSLTERLRGGGSSCPFTSILGVEEWLHSTMTIPSAATP